MSMQRTIVFSLTALISLAQQMGATEFSDRLAAWQAPAPAARGRPAPTAPPTAAPATPQDEMPAEAGPATTTPRLLAESYTPPVHAPGHYHPWGGRGMGHAPMYAPSFDHYGTCDMGCGGACGYAGPSACPGGPGCGPCGHHGVCGYSPILWAKFDVLMWWRQGRDYPPLVTTDSSTDPSDEAGILPDATILFGGDRDGTDMQAGGRFDIGSWTTPQQCFGIGWRFFGLGKDSAEFNISSLENPVLALPFRDVDDDVNDALLIAFPGLRSGEIHVAATSDVIGNDVYGRFLLCRGWNSRFDFLTGWHYSRIDDDLLIRTRSTITEVGGSIPVGTVFDTRDQFEARSEFNGGILGLMWEGHCGCCSTNVMARMSIGNMHETMRITGSTRIAEPNQTPLTSQGGALTAASNIGQFSRDEFTAVTEVGVNFAWRFARCTQFTLGYTFIYWNDVLDPGDAIDPNISPSQDEDRPQFVFRHSDYWVQGINLGIVKEF